MLEPDALFSVQDSAYNGEAEIKYTDGSKECLAK
jgi:hypothetical protein